jgi:hypothetical protein
MCYEGSKMCGVQVAGSNKSQVAGFRLQAASGRMQAPGVS